MRLLPIDEQETTDDWFTPKQVFDILGVTFDLDVAAPAGGVPWVPATRFYTESDDGLTSPWEGFVWCNPPYSAPSKWLDRMVDHGDGIILVRADLSSGGYWHAWNAADVAWFPAGRLQFVNGHGGATSSVTFSTVLLGFGQSAIAAFAGVPGAKLLSAVDVK